METRANSLTVGIFVLATFAIGVLFAIWLGSSGSGGPKKEFFVVFSNSVQGLDKGSYVLFNGLRVGDVGEIGINPANTSQVRARIVVDELTPIKKDSKASLTYAGLTGVASIEVTGGSPNSAYLVPGPDGMPPTLYAEQSFVQNIMESGSKTLGNINEVVAKINQLVDDNSEAITATVADMRKAVSNFESMMARANENGLIDNLNETAKTIRETAQTLDKRITIITTDISNFTDKGLKELSGLISDGRKTLNSIDKAVNNIDRNPQGIIFGKPSVPTYKGQ